MGTALPPFASFSALSLYSRDLPILRFIILRLFSGFLVCTLFPRSCTECSLICFFTHRTWLTFLHCATSMYFFLFLSFFLFPFLLHTGNLLSVCARYIHSVSLLSFSLFFHTNTCRTQLMFSQGVLDLYIFSPSLFLLNIL